MATRKTSTKPSEKKPANEAVQNTATDTPEANDTADDSVTGTLAGAVDNDGNAVALADMPEETLREIGADLEIVDASKLPVDQLVEEIQAHRVAVKLGPDLLLDEADVKLRERAIELGIEGAETLPVGELIEAIVAHQPMASTGGETGSLTRLSGMIESGDDYVVNRHRFRHNGYEHTFGAVVTIADPRQAAELLAIGAILETN